MPSLRYWSALHRLSSVYSLLLRRPRARPALPLSNISASYAPKSALARSSKTPRRGTRTIAQIVSGSFEGPRLKASVQSPAGDWITNRADGSYRLDVRLTLKTEDGALILVTYNGVGQTTAAGASLRAAPLFETGDPRYTWLTRLQAVAVGERTGSTVSYDIYALK